ncbi:hypothetical protein HPT25_17310 [Bacillus sp. BRMEA1]|uniref:hypothetical protein n=1 Tax=Neobacillus endophyticus TaxID=2738405 RepID=UPI001566E8B6|nr:hypothetical protein [Neobacillus endophyticus]NRD79119.1 hypothetical protein [Neobacillus endophyticus]
MSGWVKLTKQFTNDELWFNVTAFRLYVWILMKASYEDGIVLNGMRLKKGQYIRAYSQLSEDLMYIEGRAKKALAKSTVKRAVDKLVKKGLLMAEETPLGTLFTVVNSDDFRCLDGTGDFFCPPFRETTVEHSPNDKKTEPELNIKNQEFKNLNKNGQHHSQENHSPEDQESESQNQNDQAEDKEKRINRIASRFVTLRNNGLFLSPKDELAIERIGELPLTTEQLEVLLEEIFHEFHMKNPNGEISSAMYCEKVIRTKLETKKNTKLSKKSKKESMSERVERLIQEGKIK